MNASPSLSERIRPRWHTVALFGVLALAVFLHFFRLEQEGFANLYYAAAVKSMLTSLHNFFFIAFDPAGFVAVDKPPLGLWVQALSALALGFRGWSLLFPQALAGVLSVALIYHLVARLFGPTAGLVAALVLALTPISVAANRNNTMDSLLVFTSLLAAWTASLAAERGRLRWLLLTALLVGVGFNIKMLQAYLVLPALFMLYLTAAPLCWWKRLLHLALATIVLIVVSLSWAVVVDATPAEQRPFVGSSQNNSVMELIVGHNGVERLGALARIFGLGRYVPGPPPPGNRPLPGPPPGVHPSMPGAPPGQALLPAGPGQPPAPGTPLSNPPIASGGETGLPGALRLFNRQLGGQTSWFLPLALLCLLAAAWQRRLTWPLHRQHQSLLLWATWLLPQVLFFSFAGLFHRYYLEMMSPAIAALLGAGLVALWRNYQHSLRREPGASRWKGWLLPAAFALTAFVELAILLPFPELASWLAPLVLGLPLTSAIGLVVLRFAYHPITPDNVSTPRISAPWQIFLARGLAMLGLLALLIAPAVWTVIPVWYGGDTGLPFAGPELIKRGPRMESLPRTNPLADYLLANQRGESFILATVNSRDAAPIILATGKAVMAMGGFSGGDRILTPLDLQGLVAAGEVRFFLLPIPAEPPPPGVSLKLEPVQQVELVQWIVAHCQAVPGPWWNAPPAAPNRPPIPNPVEPRSLWDCRL